jgi:hypothetical protein
MRKDNSITVQNLTTQDMLELVKHNISKPFVSRRGQSAARERVSEVPWPNEAMHGRPHDHGSDPVPERQRTEPTI